MKKRILAITLALLPALWLTGCQTAETKSASAAPAKSAAQISAEQAIAAAKAAIAAGNEWRDTGKIIKAAEKALKAGDAAKAKKLAETAEFQGKTAVAQAGENAGAGNPNYLYQ